MDLHLAETSTNIYKKRAQGGKRSQNLWEPARTPLKLSSSRYARGCRANGSLRTEVQLP